MLLSIGIQAYRFAAEPFIFSLVKGERSERVQADVMKFYFIVALLISVSLICLDDLALLLIGEDFRVGAPVIPILLGAYIFYGAVFNLSFWYKLNDKTIYGAAIALGGALVTIVLNVWLVPKIGYYGSAWATLAAYVFMTIISYSLMRKHHPMPYDLSSIGQYVLVAVSMVFIFEYLDPQGWAKYLGGTAVIVIFALFAIFKERKQLRINDDS